MIQILQVQLLNIFSKLKDLFSPILVFDGVDKKHPNLVRELNSRLENLFWIMHPTTHQLPSLVRYPKEELLPFSHHSGLV